MFVAFYNDDEEFDFNYLNNGEEHVVTAQFGYDDVTDCTFSIFVSLSPLAGGEPESFELVFCLIEYDHDQEAEYQIWNGADSKPKIPDEDHRSMCVGMICSAVRYLIERVSPRAVSMFSNQPYLPEKAMLKYKLVAAVFAQSGFTVGQPDPYYGKHAWLMERLT